LCLGGGRATATIAAFAETRVTMNQTEPEPGDLPAAPPADPPAAAPEPAPVPAVAEAPAAEAPAAEASVEPAAAPAPPPELSPAACAARLSELFPALFGPGGPPKPIKLRIQVDIQARAPGVFSKRSLSLFLSRYTTSTAYIKALLASGQRFDLDGQPAGEIEELHRAAATQELARRREVVEVRRAAERETRRAAERQARSAQREQERAHHLQREAERRREEEHQRAAQAENETEGAARRDRFALLRAFEGSTLTKANFCALKRMREAELDAVLAQARQERDQRPTKPPR
jgi:ProP effector